MSDEQAMNYCRQLSDFEASVRRFAVKKLIELKNPLSIPYLVDVLSDDDIFVKTNAEDALFELGNPIIPHLIKKLDNDVAEVRLRALSVYRRLDTSEGLENLIPLLLDPDTDVRNSALGRLQKGLDAKASLKLWEFIKNPSISDEIKEICSDLLNKNIVGISNEIVTDIDSSSIDEGSLKLGCKLFIQLKPDGHKFFLDKINSDIPEMRIASLISKSNFETINILSLAKEKTNDSDADVRKIAVKLIGENGGEGDLLLLNELLNSPEKGVWKVSKEAIDRIKSGI